MYKIIREDKVIDVVKNPQFVRFLPYGHIALTDRASAQGITGSDNQTLYSFKPVAIQGVETATIKAITTEEFNRLYSLLNSEQEDTENNFALSKAKQTAIKRLSATCKAKITAGFSVKLRDGKLYDFKLTAEDQLNLMGIENQLNAGAETFIYHAADQLCQVFVREDMQKILAAFRRHTLYHTTYFNVAKQYIKSLTDIEAVNSFTYGMDVSAAAGNNVLKQILRNGDVCR